MNKIENFIDGRFFPPKSNRYLENFEPATGKVYSQVADSESSEVEQAVTAAEKAFFLWSNMPASERAKYLDKMANEIEARMEDFARAESIDTGKPLTLTKNLDIPRAISNLRFFASAISQFAGESYQTDNLAINYTLRLPVGIVGCITPWNLPLYLLTWKIAPALAAGNVVIAKPSELTPQTATMLAELAVKVGLPAGVLNILNGRGPQVGEAIVSHPKIRAISFTGGTKTGAQIAKIAAPLFKKLSLELGGKNPTIVFGDCNFEEAVNGIVRSSFLNQGQICLCGSRIFVQKSLYEKFKSEFVNRTQKLKVGDPSIEGTDQGALISEAHFKKVLSAVQTAKDEGGRILAGGSAAKVSGRCQSGWFMEPTIIEGLPSSCRTNQEEIFGPVVTLIPFESEAEVIAAANSTAYGLSASIWSQDVGRCHRMAAQIQSGIIWVNSWLLRDLRTPFGGMKDSGVGREGGMEALKFVTETKNVCIKIS